MSWTHNSPPSRETAPSSTSSALHLPNETYGVHRDISYLTARPSRDLVTAAYQEVTREWWRDAAVRLRLVASELVVREASAGDPVAARDRLEALEKVELLDTLPDDERLSRALVDRGAVPRVASEDAAHIAIAATNGVDFLVTWNFSHIANVEKRARIEDICRQAGYDPPAICTPSELMGTNHDETSV